MEKGKAIDPPGRLGDNNKVMEGDSIFRVLLSLMQSVREDTEERVLEKEGAAQFSSCCGCRTPFFRYYNVERILWLSLNMGVLRRCRGMEALLNGESGA